MTTQNDFQYYPTPRSLVIKAWDLFKNRDFTRVLEPSAGKGHLADAEHISAHRRPTVDCIEIDITKHSLLRDKGHSVVGIDFLQFEGGAIYSHIIMNPPFAQGAQHVLKAWQILYDGEIVAILNAETLRNPYSKERQMLLKLVNEYGTVEYMTEAFATDETERKTDVEIALIHLTKKSNFDFDVKGNILDSLKKDQASKEDLAYDFSEIHEIALTNTAVENAVLSFNAACRAMQDAVFTEARARYYTCMIGSTMDRIYSHNERNECDLKWVQKTIHERYTELKDRAWANILHSTEVTNRLSSKAHKRMLTEFEVIKQLEFTVQNIYGFLSGLIQNQGEIQIGMVCDVFDEITRYHEDNTVYYLGWKSNSKHRTAGMRIKMSRFILPHNNSYGHGLSWEATQRLRDFDKVFAMLDGKLAPEVSLELVFNQHFSALQHGERIDSSYFQVRYYPGRGTIHFFPKDKKLIDRLNRMVGAQRNWLPPVDQPVNEAFWVQFTDAEKFDREVRKEVSQSTRHRYWRSPYWALNARDDKDREDAHDVVAGAIVATLEKRGFNVQTMLEKQEQLLLSA